jgi:DNA-binding NtrC family response regulator
MDSTPNPSSVLIVEDDHMVLATIKLTLESEHFDVVSCLSPRQALKLLADRDFAVIISDNKMPEMMGLDFLVECRRLRPQSSRILLTAVLDLPTALDAINRGEICRFISKPWITAELVSAVRGAIQRHELAGRNQRLRTEACRLNVELTASNRALQARVDELERRQIQDAEAVPAGR